MGILYAGFFLIDFDLVVVNPLLVPVSHDLGTSLRTVTLALTAYLLLFGILQPAHGIVSDAVGRVPVLRVALLGIGVGNAIAALSPDVGTLIAGRSIAGAFGAALIPLTLAYVGESVPVEVRQRTMAGLLAVGALGTAASTVVAGALTELASWRLALVPVAVAGPVLALLYGRLPETVTRTAARTPLREILRGGWLRFLVAFAVVEGAAMLGFFNFFNAALQVHGHGVLTAGLVTSAYGLAALAGGALVGAVESKVSQAAMFATGGTLLCASFTVAAYRQSAAGILIASALAGIALSVGQSTIQTWGVEVARPGTLGTVASLVACAVFTGAAAGTAAVGGLATAGGFGRLFAVAAAVTVPVTVVGAAARVRFARGLDIARASRESQ